MPTSYVGKTALVTGATSGIGMAIARMLAKHGANVVALGRNSVQLDALAAEFGGSWLSIRADVTVEADIETAVREAVQRFGSLHVAFNVAGGGSFSPILGGNSDDWHAVVDLCLRGAYHCIKHEAQQMATQETGGAIVNISSLNQEVPLPGSSAYASAKAGLGMLTKNTALELAAHGVRVNAVLPGLVDTPATAFLKAAPAVAEAYLNVIPMRRVGAPDEIARVALFLASDAASYVTGASLIVDGGWV